MQLPVINQLRSLDSDRTSNISQPSADRLFTGSKMNGRQRQIDSLKTGTSLSRLYSPTVGMPTAQNSVLRQMLLTNNTTPQVDEVLPEGEATLNAVHKINRVSKRVKHNLDAIGQYELAILFKRRDACDSTMYGSGFGQPDTEYDIMNPAHWNYVMYLKQLADSKQPDEYLRKTPDDYFTAYFSVEGTVGHEMALNGAESTLTSGFPRFGEQRLMQQAGGAKRLTIFSKGLQPCYNYWGENIKPGGHCYAIIKKFSMQGEYVLCNKRNIAGIAGTRSDLPAPLITVDQTKKQVPLRPYQMCFVCLPDGGPMPPEYLHYYDERGTLRRDGLAIFLGTVGRVPIDHIYKDIDNSATRAYTGLHAPFTNANKGARDQSTMLMYLHFDCKDGLLPV